MWLDRHVVSVGGTDRHSFPCYTQFLQLGVAPRVLGRAAVRGLADVVLGGYLPLDSWSQAQTNVRLLRCQRDAGDVPLGIHEGLSLEPHLRWPGGQAKPPGHLWPSRVLLP